MKTFYNLVIVLSPWIALLMFFSGLGLSIFTKRKNLSPESYTKRRRLALILMIIGLTVTVGCYAWIFYIA